jgi:plastocyanin
MRTTRTALTAIAIGAALTLTACGGGTDTSNGDTAADSATAVSITGTDSLKFDKTELEVAADEEITVTLTAEGSVAHDFVIEDLDDLMVAEAGAGETATGTVTLEAGSYTYYCSVVGHRQGGMEGTITAG